MTKNKDTKVVLFTIMDGGEEEINAMSKALVQLKDKLPYEIEFIVSNEKIQMRDVKQLLIELYQRDKRGL